MNVLDIIKMDIKSYRFVTCCMKPEDDILFFNCQENIEIDLSRAMELVQNRLEFTKSKKHYLIHNLSNILNISPDALEYLKDRATGLKNIKGLAYVASNTHAVKIADVLIENQKKIPVKIFFQEEEAIIWIKQLKEYHVVTQQ